MVWRKFGVFVVLMAVLALPALANGTATLTVVKQVEGPAPDTPWQFTVEKQVTEGQWSPVATFTLPAGGGQFVLVVESGTYKIIETTKPGYTCMWAIDGEQPTVGNEAEVPVGSGGEVTVTFVNTAQPATIRVEKQVQGPSPDSDWEFTVKKDETTITTFTLPASGGSLSFQVEPGQTYTIIETTKDGYTCTVNDEKTSEATVTVGPGDEVTVTFVNTKKAKITVEKVVEGPEPEEDWTFTGNLGEFTISKGGGEETFEVEPGTYTITETTKPGYTCKWFIDEGQPTEGNQAEVNVGPGDEVTVTFVNTAKATLTVVKQVVGPAPADEWQFTVLVGQGVIDTFTLPAGGGQQDLALEPGTYTITETPKDGYICTVGGQVANQVIVTLTAGESKTITFVNTRSQSANNSFPAGWNLLSVPFVPVPDTPEAVFGDDVSPLYIFWWDPVQGKYVTPTQIDPGRGYWLYLFGQTTIDVTGLVPEEDYEVPLGPKGWHMISTPTVNVFWRYCEFRVGGETKTWSDAVQAEWIEPFFWQYDVATGQYVAYGENPADVLRPWVGYWIKTNVDNVTVILPIKYMLTNPPVPPAGLGLLGAGMPMETPPAPPSLAALAKDFLTVLAYPNPATASTVTFRALGLPVEGIRVSVFDLGGRRVWAGEAVGHELAWNLADSSGRPLANGVYLYVVEARLSGEWVSTGLQRLLILR